MYIRVIWEEENLDSILMVVAYGKGGERRKVQE
jgi:hypothetical protein